MKPLPLILVAFAAILPQLHSQSDPQVERYFQQFPEADANGDGTLTREEARIHRQNARRDPSEGDNLNSQSRLPGIVISEKTSPVKVVELKSPDGVDLSYAYRMPPGSGPHPTIVFFHGGGGMSNLGALKNNLLQQPIQTRFLQRGYATVAATRRPYWKTNDGSPSGFYDAVEDAATIVENVKFLSRIDPNRVVVYGGSGGAILAIAAASKIDFACVVAGEPATVVPLDPKTGQTASPADYRALMDDPVASFTPERKREMRAWMKKIHCPILILQGEPVGLYKTNFEILVPELTALGKEVATYHYPGVTHGFYWGTVKTGATLKTVDAVMRDVTAFIDSRASQ